MWGIVPSGGVGSRIQPLACSKALLPVGTRGAGNGHGDEERPRALGEYVVDRMAAAGVTRFCFVVGPTDGDLLGHFGSTAGGRPAAYVVQESARGLCDAIFCALPLVRPEEPVIVGLPDTLWFPEHALRALPEGGLSFLCFPVSDAEGLEAVVSADDGEVRAIDVGAGGGVPPGARWVWGAFKLDGATLRALHELWCERGREDTSIGVLVDAWLARGGSARAVKAGEVYVDVDTPNAYRDAMRLVART
jgi:dTDP-glucose pyrophosphorylase